MQLIAAAPFALVALCLSRGVLSFNPQLATKFLRNALVSASISLSLASYSPPVLAASDAAPSASVLLSDTSVSAPRDEVSVYFGVGCFWHVQHEFVAAERSILGRGDDQLTSRTGYAGGKSVGSIRFGEGVVKPAVCYHNLQGVADYGSLGHGEVVAMTVPKDKLGAFADEYFGLFGKDLERPDKGDRGGEYRSLLGLPGGSNSPLFKEISAAAEKKGLKLLDGKGNDADTLGKKAVWVMDSDAFPVYQAELYHQFHDGFMPGEQYPEKYNALRQAAMQRGLIARTGCPDI